MNSMTSYKEMITNDKSCWGDNVMAHTSDFGKKTNRYTKISYVIRPKKRNFGDAWGLSKSTRIRSDNTPPVDKMFQQLSDQWKNETKGLSLAASKINNTNYLTIIRLGVTFPDKVTKLILKDLKESSSYWHYALKKITHANPVPKQFTTNPKKARDYWLMWAHDNNKF